MAKSVRRRTPRTRRKVSETLRALAVVPETRESLSHVEPLVSEQVAIPGVAWPLRIARPRDLSRLLDAAESDPEQNLPYWAEIWPSGVALAAAVATRHTALRGQRVLELGCGLGITAIAAVRAGAAVLATDYSLEALALCRLNCRREAGTEPDTRRINWRRDRPFGREGGTETFSRVLAADVLYERRDVEPLLELVSGVVAPGGELWLAEPGRAPAILFLELLRARGWAGEREQCAGPWPDPEDNRKQVVVTVHFLRRSSS
jgi:predicted nicotinamide N-methyase